MELPLPHWSDTDEVSWPLRHGQDPLVGCCLDVVGQESVCEGRVKEGAVLAFLCELLN